VCVSKLSSCVFSPGQRGIIIGVEFCLLGWVVFYFLRGGSDVDWQSWNIPVYRSGLTVVCSWNGDQPCEEFHIRTFDRELHSGVGTWLPNDRKSCWLKIVAIGVRHWRNLG
jgi:hypothetical protein